MLAAYTELKNAEKVKLFLLKKDLFNSEYLPLKEMGFIYFPINKKVKVPNAKVTDTKFKFKKRTFQLTIDQILKNKLTKKELDILPRSQEIVGKIMVLEIPEELKSKETLIAQAYLKVNRNIETVVKKGEMHSGTFRLRKVQHLAGKKTKETVHKENGIQLKLNLEKTYFSARSANERLRIAKQIKKNENVLVMFSGAAPFLLTIAKNSKARNICGIEINPLAHKFALENVKLNNFNDKIVLYLGDVKKIMPKMRKKFDHIAMPLPKTGEEFLKLALSKSKPGTIINLYSFLTDEEIPKFKKKIKEICKNKIRILRVVKCGQFSPQVNRTCFDLKVI